MPTANSKPPAPPLLELSWTSRKNGCTKAIAIKLSLPMVAGAALLLGSTHADLAKKLVKALVQTIGFGP